MGLLKTLFFIIVISYIIRLIRYYLSPLFNRYIARKVQQQFRSQYQNKGYESSKPGETTIDKMPNKTYKSNNKVGEYVDYEEVD